MNKLILCLSLVLASFGLASTAGAANESIELSLAAEPRAGSLFKEVHRPLNASLTVSVSNPDIETSILPLKRANVTFPRDMEFFPNPRKTPACTDEKLNESSNLAAGISAIVALCPDSVIGTGSSTVQLAQAKIPLATVTDPKLIIFNAGRNSAGRPAIKIYGFSRVVNSGLLMKGVLARDGQLRIDIGVLPYDSSVSTFTMGIPGDPVIVDETGSGGTISTYQGGDPGYLRGRCSTGTWTATGEFVLGTRSHPSGSPLGPESLLTSNTFSLPCQGKTGKPRLKIDRVSGPRTLKSNRKAGFIVRVSNTGTATAKRLRIAVTGAGRGSQSGGSLSPGASRRIAVKVKAGRRALRGRLRFRVTANETVHKDFIRKLKVG